MSQGASPHRPTTVYPNRPAWSTAEPYQPEGLTCHATRSAVELQAADPHDAESFASAMAGAVSSLGRWAERMSEAQSHRERMAMAERGMVQAEQAAARELMALSPEEREYLAGARWVQIGPRLYEVDDSGDCLCLREADVLRVS